LGLVGVGGGGKLLAAGGDGVGVGWRLARVTVVGRGADTAVKRGGE
jgi:hypothetical protein